MSLVFARMEPIDPTVRIVTLACVAAVVALALGVYLWVSFRNNR